VFNLCPRASEIQLQFLYTISGRAVAGKARKNEDAPIRRIGVVQSIRIEILLVAAGAWYENPQRREVIARKGIWKTGRDAIGQRAMVMNALLLVAVGFALPLGAIADELDCNDMENVVREMLVDNMRIPQYLALDTAEAANVSFALNYFHAERREYNRTFCSATVRFNRAGFAEAERRSAGMSESHALERMVEAAAVGGLAAYASFPEGFKIFYKLDLTNNATNWVVTLLNDPPTDHMCSLPNPHTYFGDSAGDVCPRR
jgi:hypothetical protein